MALLDVKNVSVSYVTQYATIAAVSDCSFSVGTGEILGIVGESGCGKSTLVMAVTRLLPPNGVVRGGKAIYKGVNLFAMKEHELQAVRWKEIALICQGSMNSLNPVLRVSEQMTDVYVQKMGAPYSKARKRAAELFKRVGLDVNRLDDYPHQFSGGMKQRVMIAMSLVCDPQFLVADELTTALDVIIRGEVLDLLSELQHDMSLSLVVVSHDIAALSVLCTTIVVMYAGSICEISPASEFFTCPIHPYSIALLSSYPTLDENAKRESLSGYPPDLSRPIKGCPFYDRCSQAESICQYRKPQAIKKHNGRLIYCHNVRRTANE